ncbi:Alpha/Beta hydrolase protein [Ephemerocybe angulata]|uniref:Alpha/Beta hydrolase protein n=1 Tax=Ephemerocybe angulata TaxID=980116 RepID=A0A8H6I872_9AGAR|nr:Alpha/Beta hydrolase protein [Tulosesus angulatus]
MASAILNATISLTERYVSSSDGTQIFAQAVGQPHLPTLVFVHGFALSALVWAHILRDTNLLRYFHLVAYDLRGHGRSGKPAKEADYSSKLGADDFIAVTEAFNATKPLFVGWSLGGTYASDVLQHYGPDALSGIIWTAGLPYLAASPTVLTPWIQNTVLPAISSVDNATLGLSIRQEFTNALFNHPEKVPTEVLWSWLGSTTLQDPAKITFPAGPGRGNTQDPTNLFEAGKKGVPLLIINGDADRFVIGEETVKAVKGKWKDLTVYTAKNGSHVFFYEEKEEYVAQVLRFARRVFKV